MTDTLRSHQTAALIDINAAIGNGGTCLAVLPTGAGKTHIAAAAIRQHATKGVAVLATPSRMLVEQTSHTISRLHPDRPLLAISSTPVDGIPTTTEPADIRDALDRHPDLQIITTYASTPTLAEAMGDLNITADLAIGDEAHHLADPDHKRHAGLLRGDLPAHRRLLLTATPGRLDVPAVHTLTLSQAIDAHIVADYQVVLATVTPEDLHGIPDGADPRLAVGVAALLRTIDSHQLSRLLVYLNRIDRAELFLDLLQRACIHQPPPRDGWASLITSTTSADDRRRLLDRLLSTPADQWGVIAGVRAISEGIDVPSLDGVAIVDPRASTTDVVQAVGRVLRRTGATPGTLLLPIAITGDGSINEGDTDVAVAAISALIAHDPDLADRLAAARRTHSRTGTPASQLLDDVFGGRLSITGTTPPAVLAGLADKVCLDTLARLTDDWDASCGLLEQWADVHGHSDIPAATMVPTADGTVALGRWATTQRSLHAAGQLSSQRQALLEAIPGWTWNAGDSRWQQRYDELCSHLDDHGTYPTAHASSLGTWVSNQRRAHRDGWMHPDRQRALEQLPGWQWAKTPPSFTAMHAALAAYASRHGHASPTARVVVDGDDGQPVALGVWVSGQRSRRQVMSDRQRQALQSLPGWTWSARDAAWDTAAAEAAAFIADHPEVPIRSNVAGDADASVHLGRWVHRQRKLHAAGRLDATRVQRLNDIPGWQW